jgi:transposase
VANGITPQMSDGPLTISGYSSVDVRVRAVSAVITKGFTVTDAAAAYGTTRSTIHRWLARFHEEGDAGLDRKAVCGRPRKLMEVDSAGLKKIVLSPASEYGFETDFWTTRRLIQVVQTEYGVLVSKQTMMRRLHEAGLTYQKPERQYFELSEEERQAWRRTELPKIRRAVRKYRGILYFEDEANISLTALLGRTWAPRGKTPKQRVTGNRGGVSAMSAITRSGQLIFRLHEKRIKSEEVIEFLNEMLKHHSRRHLVVVMDKAPPHTSQRTLAFIASQPRLHVFHLPTYSPDWNPDEQVWNHLKHQELKGHQARTNEELKNIATQELAEMATNKELLHGIFFRCCMADALSK